MAPKGGKGGGGGRGGGGVSKCVQCLAPLELYGSDWESKSRIAIFAVYIIVALALVVSLLIQTRFSWNTIRDGVEKRKKRFFYAAGFLLISYILYIIDVALHEENHTTTHLYYLLYIFAQPFWRIAEILILVIIYRTIAESSISNLAYKLGGLHKVLIVLIALTSVITYGFYVTQQAGMINGNYYGGVVTQGLRYGSVAYYALYLLAALLAGVESLTVLLKARSKATLLMLTIVTPFLILHALVYLISLTLTLTSRRPASYLKTRLAISYIGEITNIFIYLGVVMVGFLISRSGKRRAEKERGLYVGGSANGQFAGADGGVNQTRRGRGRGWRFWER